MKTTMKVQSVITLLLLIILNSCGAQSTDKKIDGIKIPTPEGWKDNSDLSINENLSNFDFDENEIEELLKTNNNSIPVAIYMKYEQSEHNGPIPTIQVNLRPNNSPSLKEFKEVIQNSISQMGNYFTNFEVLTPLKETTVDGVKGFMFLSQFDLSNGTNVWVIRSWSYAFPSGDYFYQINFSDTEDENCEDVYENVLKEIKFSE
jgi:hypothetical protein